MLALQLLGVIDLIDDEEDEPDDTPVVAEQIVDDDELDEGPGEEDLDGDERTDHEVNRLLEIARDDMESNRLASALERLERAQGLDPERIEPYEMKAEVHEELGEMDEAEEFRERAEELREQEAADEAPPEDEPEE